jgi:hypothetical protein
LSTDQVESLSKGRSLFKGQLLIARKVFNPELLKLPRLFRQRQGVIKTHHIFSLSRGRISRAHTLTSLLHASRVCSLLVKVVSVLLSIWSRPTLNNNMRSTLPKIAIHEKVITTTTMDCRRRMQQFLVFAGVAAPF